MIHIKMFGQFGAEIPRDANGFVPELGDDWRQMNFAMAVETREYLHSGEPTKVAAAEAHLDRKWWPSLVKRAAEAVFAAKALVNAATWDADAEVTLVRRRA